VLGPFDQALKTDLVTSSNHHVGYFTVGNSSANGLGGDAKKSGSLGDGNTDDVHGFSFLNRECSKFYFLSMSFGDIRYMWADRSLDPG